MPHTHRVRPGETLSGIANQYGFFPASIWDHPANAGLRERRDDPNVLMPDDEVVIPDRAVKALDCDTGARHRFQRRGVPAKLHVRLVANGTPLANTPYLLEVDHLVLTGETDADGLIDQWVPPRSRRGLLRFATDGVEQCYELRLGRLDPIEQPSGIQGRLLDLGFDCGPVDGQLGERTRAAIAEFQHFIGHPDPSGEPDDDTLTALRKLHDER